MSKQLSAFAVYSTQSQKRLAASKKKLHRTKTVQQEPWTTTRISNGNEYSNYSNETENHTEEMNNKIPHNTINKQTTKIKTENTRKDKVHTERKKRKADKTGIQKNSSKKRKTFLRNRVKLANGAPDTFSVTDIVNVDDSSDSDVPELVEPQISDDVKTPRLQYSPNDNELEENSFDNAKKLLNFLLGAIEIDDFFKKYWEKRPLHVSRQNTTYFQNLLTSEGLDKMLRENSLYYTKNVDVVTYENDERLTHNPEGRAKPASVWDYYSNNCSVRILNPQTYSHKIRTLLATLQEYFGTMVGANIYLTPHSSQGFAPHYDDIEAFVLQLEGRKHWKIYSPRSESEILPRYSSSNLKREELGYPLAVITVEAGDLLYFPRGFIHEASTDAEAHSLHITVSVYQNTSYVDLLERLLPEALKAAAKDDVEFRQGLPLHYLRELGTAHSNKSSSLRNTVTDTVQKLITKLTNYAQIDWAADQMGRKFMHDALPPVLSHSEKQRSSKYDGERLKNGVVENRAEFGLDTKVRLVRYHSLRLTLESDGSAKLYYCTENANVYHEEEEQSLDIDTGMFDVVQTLIKNYPNYISIEDIPNQNETEKINIISDLWEKGLIVTQEPLEVVDN